MANHPCFWNQIDVGPGNQNFVVNAGAVVVPAGRYASFLSLRNAFMTAAQAVVATLRSGVSNIGHFTVDNNGGAAFSITFTDAELGYLLGFTGNLAAANTYTGPRRIGASLYLEHGGGPHPATIREHDPVPEMMHVAQTDALSGKRRTTRSGVRRDAASFELQFLDNTARFVSPTTATGTTYASAATGTYDIGLTQYTHARDRWWDSTLVAAQGWSDGRKIRYFEDSAGATFSTTAAAWAFSGSPYTEWIPDAESCRTFARVKSRPPQTTRYNLTVGVVKAL